MQLSSESAPFGKTGSSYWGNQDGVEVLAKVVEQNKAVVLLFCSYEVTPECWQSLFTGLDYWTHL